ncbi:MAG: hypothetical protein WCJ95_06150 [Mariniphaga sp.]
MKSTTKSSLILDDQDEQNVKIQKLKMDLYHLRDNLSILEMLINSKQVDSVKAYLPDIKHAIFELEYHTMAT